MTLFNNVQMLCNENKTNFARLEKKLGFGNGTVQKWDRINPGIDKIQAVADYFDVSIDELLGREDYWISKEAHKLVAQYELLPEEKRDLVRCYISVLQAG